MDMNIDIKDLIAKVKSKSGKKDARKGNSLTKFFEKNPKMKIILPAVIVAIALAVAVIIIISGVNTDTELGEDVTVAGQSVAVLPQLERNESETLADGVDPFAEDVIANAKITGIVDNSDGYKTAILKTEYASYIVQAGDYVGGSEWLVESITDTEVTCSIGEKVRTIQFKEN